MARNKETYNIMSVLLNQTAAAQRLNIKPKTLCRWRWEGRGPVYCRIGGAIRYRPEDLEAFIRETAVRHG